MDCISNHYKKIDSLDSTIPLVQSLPLHLGGIPFGREKVTENVTTVTTCIYGMTAFNISPESKRS